MMLDIRFIMGNSIKMLSKIALSFVSQCFYWIQFSGLSRWIQTKKNTDNDSEG